MSWESLKKGLCLLAGMYLFSVAFRQVSITILDNAYDKFYTAHVFCIIFLFLISLLLFESIFRDKTEKK